LKIVLREFVESTWTPYRFSQWRAYFTWGHKILSTNFFHICWAMKVKFDAGTVCIKQLRKGKFRINCCSEHCTVRKQYRNSCPYSVLFHIIWKDFGTRDIQITLLNICEFRASLRSSSLGLLRGRKYFCPYLTVLCPS
jgi:hypothetical protein